MHRTLKLFTVFFSTAIAVVSVSSNSYAVPAFARQVGVACSACHFQHFPELNAFGRAFKSSGYTMVGGTLIEDQNLSIPAVLNAAFVIKFRYMKENGTDKTTPDGSSVITPTNPQVDTPINTGLLNFPDEASIFFAGRGGEHVGFITEWGKDGLANFMMPIGSDVGDGHISIIPFTTDALGAQAGFELLNTGAVGNIRAFEDSKRVMSAQRYIGTTDVDNAGTAEGLALVYANSLGFVNATLWTPQHAGAGGDAPVKSWSNYLRAAVTPTIGSWDLGLGIQYWGGTSETNGSVGLNNGPLTRADTKALGIDAQAQGAVGNMPLGIYLSYGKADASSATGTANLFNSTPGGNDKTATSISAELGVFPNKLTLGVGYRAGNNGAATNSTDNAYAIAAIYKLAQNVQIGLTQTMMSGDANGVTVTNPDGSDGKTATAQTMLNVFAAF